MFRNYIVSMLFCSQSANVTFPISGVSSYSEGEYSCNATNTAGWGVGRTELDVRGEGEGREMTRAHILLVTELCQ